jgi:UDP-N-acetylmuramyl pentapeptide phosphotransferase/UDP-N-acetylglucosamine-1-phosphate transferase
MGAAALGFWFLGAALTRVDVPFVDELFRYGPVALVVTVVAVGGVTNAINIIDGFNGLSGMVGVMILAALGYVAYVLGDHGLHARVRGAVRVHPRNRYPYLGCPFVWASVLRHCSRNSRTKLAARRGLSRAM